MNHPLPNMMDTTMGKIREMIGANAIVGDPIQAGAGVTKGVRNNRDNPFGGGTGCGVNITPIAFLIIRGDNVRMMPISMPVDSAMDRLMEQLPDLLDKLSDFMDKRKAKAAQEASAE